MNSYKIPQIQPITHILQIKTLRISQKMGTFLTTITQQSSTNILPSPSAYREPLIKIKQYHGMFKYICDSFVINVEQSKQIFGSQYAEKLKIWDPDTQGRIDALEIFCGLIIFAKEGTFKNKLNFLFSIFDFNEIKSLSFIDVEVIILNICNSVYKILGKNGKVNENQIAEWLANYLNKRQRVKITKLYGLCVSNSIIRQFFDIVNKFMDQPVDLPEQSPETQSISSQYTTQLKQPTQIQLTQKQKQQIDQNIQWHRDLIKKIVKIQDTDPNYNYDIINQNKQRNYGCKISWVYGINISGQSPPFIIMKKMKNNIVYRVSSMCVIQDLEINKQYIIQDQKEEISCIGYNQKFQILATAQNCKFPQLKLYKKSTTTTHSSQSNPKFIKYGTIPTNHSHGIKLIQFIMKQSLLASIGVREPNTPILIYDFIRLEIVYQIVLDMGIRNIWNPYVVIQRSDVCGSVYDSFYALGQDRSTIFQIKLKTKKKNIITPNPNYQLLTHSYTPNLKSSPITTCTTCYINLSNPYLHSYKDKSANIVIITGHQSGSLSLLTPYSKCKQQQIISGLDGPVHCIQVYMDIVVIAAGCCLYVYEIDVLVGRNMAVYQVDLRNVLGVELLGKCFRYFDFVNDHILAMTDKGQFVTLKPKQITPPSHKLPSNSITPLTEQLQVTPITKITKFSHTPIDSPLTTSTSHSQPSTNIFCLLTIPHRQNHQILLFATSNNKILCIDTTTRQVQDIWEINTVQSVVALDAVCSEQGICYVICACKSGRLYIRIDWEDSPKFYDCGSQIIDAKISRDCSYLLVATRNNYLLFFAQVNSTFTSPRKLLFQYETPCSINFLDNYKFFLVITSVKNTYLIQIPQLKHKKLHKQTQKINISKLNLKYPYTNLKQQLTYTSSCIGGMMKYSLLAMKDRDIYFFPNSNALQQGNYTILSTHKCGVLQLVVNQKQNRFYSLGRSDDALIQWEVFQARYHSKRGINQNYVQGYDTYRLEFQKQFQEMEEFAICRIYLNDQNNNQQSKRTNISQTYFFKGTKLQKLNQSIQKYYHKTATPPNNNTNPNITNKQLFTQNIIKQSSTKYNCTQTISQQNLSKRCPNINLKIKQVYGYNIHHKNSLYYHNNGQQILGYVSRFIIRTNTKTKIQQIYQPTHKKITYLLKNPYDNQILYCVLQNKPMIYILGKNSIKTTHSYGIIHMAVFRSYVLSYGKNQKNNYSINVHDYETGELFYMGYTDIKVCQFIMLSQRLVVSLNQVRIWEELYPSQPIILASSGCLLPNQKDILLGLYDGRFAILSNRGIFHLNNQAHQKQIDLISIKYSDRYVDWTMDQNRDRDRQGDVEDNFQIVSVGRDQKIKIWNSNFQVKMLIFFRQKSNLTFLGQNNKQLLMLDSIRARSINIHKNKILLALNTGHISQIQIQTAKKNQTPHQDASSIQNNNLISVNNLSERSYTSASISNFGENDSQNNSNSSYELHNSELTFKWTNIYQLHSVKQKKNSKRRTFFSLNLHLNLLATSSCDNQILIRNYQTNQILYKCYYEGLKVQCVKFTNKGNFIAIGFDNGQIRLYQVKVFKDQFQKKQSLVLKLYQKLGLKIDVKSNGKDKDVKDKQRERERERDRQRDIDASSIKNRSNFNNSPEPYNSTTGIGSFSIINMQFSQCATYLAVSYIHQSQKKYQAYLTLFKTKQSSNTIINPNPNPNPNNTTFTTNNPNPNNPNHTAHNDHEQKQENILNSKQTQIPQKVLSSLPFNNHNQMENQEHFYFQVDIIQITNNIEQSTIYSKYIKSVYFIGFYNQVLDRSPPVRSNNNNNSNNNYTNNSYITNPSGTNNNIILNSQPQQSYKNISMLASSQKKQYQKLQKTQTYLIIYEQYLDSNKIRINNDNKIKIKVYQIEDKLMYKEDYNVNFLKIRFPYFVNGRVMRLGNCYGKGYGGVRGGRYDGGQDKNGQELKFTYNDQKYDSQITLSQMLIVNNTIFYGDTTGKIHITKLNSLLPPKSPPQPQSSHNHSPSPSPTTATATATQNNSILQHSSMNLSKTYRSHVSFINSMEISQDHKYLFVSGGIDDCIVKYRIQMELGDNVGKGGGFGELDQFCYPLDFKDVHQQYLTKNKFYQFLNNIDPIRQQISDILLDVQTHKKPSSYQSANLTPIRIFGRRAFDKRNNLYQDFRGNLIYTLGPNIIIQDPLDPLNQTFIPVDPNPYSNSPQISCLSMSKDYVIAATQQQNSRIFVWDIFSKTCLSTLKLKNLSIIYNITQSSTHKCLLIYGINKLYQPSMQLINWSQKQVLGSVNMMYSGCWKIKDLCQICTQDNGYQFVSCGVQHLAYWSYIADTLVCSCVQLGLPQLRNVTFMVVKTIKDLIITGCQNGSIFLFKNSQYLTQIKLHDGTIRTLVLDNQIIYSGGMDGVVYMSSIYVDQFGKQTIRKLQQFNIKNKLTTQKPTPIIVKQSKLKRCHSLQIQQNNIQTDLILAEQDIQSLVLGRNNKNYPYPNFMVIYIGTRSGNVISIKREINQEERVRNGYGNGKVLDSIGNISMGDSGKVLVRRSSGMYMTEKYGEIQPVLWGHDNDTIVSICFNQNQPDLFYLLTYSGALEIWSLKTLKRLYNYKLAQQVHKIFCFKQYIIICCERSIRTIKIDLQNNSINYITQLSKQYDGIIIDCCLSKTHPTTPQKQTQLQGSNIHDKQQISQRDSNQNSNNSQLNQGKKMDTAYLVIGLKKNQFNQIIINQINTRIQEKFVVMNLKYQIQFMDFSRDCKYLLFKDSFQELGMVNLENFKRINTIFVEMGIEWQSQGIRISPHGQKIYCSYSRENKITVLRRIGQKQVIIGDQMGTLRIFQYPCPQDKIGELHNQCYTPHMNFIKNIEIHPNGNFLITTSVYDRSLILWKNQKYVGN